MNIIIENHNGYKIPTISYTPALPKPTKVNNYGLECINKVVIYTFNKLPLINTSLNIPIINYYLNRN